MGPLMGSDVAVAEDFYNIGHDKVTGRMCDTNGRRFGRRYMLELARYEIRNDDKTCRTG